MNNSVIQGTAFFSNSTKILQVLQIPQTPAFSNLLQIILKFLKIFLQFEDLRTFEELEKNTVHSWTFMMNKILMS